MSVLLLNYTFIAAVNYKTARHVPMDAYIRCVTSQLDVRGKAIMFKCVSLLISFLIYYAST